MNNYNSQSIQDYESSIQSYPNLKINYWHLGIALLLNGQEEAAQMTWMAAMIDGSDEDVSRWTTELVELLEHSAQVQEESGDVKGAWLILQHLCEIEPGNLSNSWRLIQLSIKLDYVLESLEFFPAFLEELDNTHQEIDPICLLELVDISLGQMSGRCILQVIHIALKVIPACDLREQIFDACTEMAADRDDLDKVMIGLDLAELYLGYDPQNLEFLGLLSIRNQDLERYEQGILFAKRRLDASSRWIDKILSSHLVLRAILCTGSHWPEASQAFEHHERLLLDINSMPETEVLLKEVVRLVTTTFFSPYFRDNPIKNREFNNKISRILEENITPHMPQEILADRQSSLLVSKRRDLPTEKLRIGYLSHCLRQHSVGWLARWLLVHHNRDEFEIYGYFINSDDADSLHSWYISQVDYSCRIGIDCPGDAQSVASKIHQDGIDILIDLDSITMDFSCEIMAYKAAPIQATWLGWDASGLPAIDYFIVDPFVVPEEADTYYSEKLLRLPETYIAVDGFEIGIQSITRRDLDIPEDSIVYITSQTGCKRHPDTIALQIKILNAVPNSYLIVKGPSDLAALESLFKDISQSVELDPNRIKFLPQAETEQMHRANLRIADVALDTFPYNGATTTLETLWMEIPLVTLVGKQFAARNSYTMLKNVGVEEGIAWTPDEYVEWGVRLGIDAVLRQNVAWKLRQSKKNSPLWNAKSFTQKMEQSYRQMWCIYGETSASPN
jgi:predicted O-linked N-acetylglucosamine transferase (SPINDLY family)